MNEVMTEVMGFTVLISALCGLAGYFIGYDNGETTAMAMYTDEQNKRVKVEYEIKHLKRTGECLSDKVIQQQKLLAEFDAETA